MDERRSGANVIGEWPVLPHDHPGRKHHDDRTESERGVQFLARVEFADGEWANGGPSSASI